MNPARELLRHTLATLAYRGGKTLRDAPAGFGDFRGCESGRTAGQILAHIGDLFDWALAMAQGKRAWKDSDPMAWDLECKRFFAALEAFDDFLATGQVLGVTEDRIFQGPVADALTHFGQIAMLRRMAGSPVKGENYFVAEIVVGRVGEGQAAPVREF